MDLAAARASLLAAETALGGRETAWDAVLRAVEVGHGLASGPVPAGLDGWAAPGAEAMLAPLHERSVAGRAGSGTFYTPPWLVEWVLDRVLDDLPASDPVLLDPACGCGAFLVPAVRRLAARSGRPAAEVARRVRGVDLDPVAVAICRLLLRIAAPGLEAASVAALVRVGDGLETGPDADSEEPERPPDLVVGNPPFLGQLRRRTARARAGAGPAAYTDTSGLFLRRALDVVAPSGRVALVQPLSLLAARDAAPVRSAVAEAGAVVDLWAAARPAFAGADVLTCVPVVHHGAPPGPVRTWRGAPVVRPGPVIDAPAAGIEWGSLAAPAYDVPTVRIAVSPAAGVLADLGPCTADFRDQYYGLVPHVRERAELPPGRPRAGVAPLVTAGLIDPARNRWGSTPTRFARRSWDAPVVDLDALRGDTDHRAGAKLARWATARLVPKVLVATQGRVLEAVVDVEGAWLPSVPVLTLAAPADRLWHVLAVLLAPPVVAHAASRYLGAALGPGSVKLSASQCGGLPLPPDGTSWDDGARHAEAAQRSGEAGDDPGRVASLLACATAMTAAYGLDPDGVEGARVLSWWRDRARLNPDPITDAVL